MPNLYLIAYDIREDRARSRVAQRLEDLGARRINYSLYECLLRARQVEPLMVELSLELDDDTDRLACYPVCQACYRRAYWWPAPPGPWPGEVYEV